MQAELYTSEGATLLPGYAQRGEAAEGLCSILACPEHSRSRLKPKDLPELPSWPSRRPYLAASPASAQRRTKGVSPLVTKYRCKAAGKARLSGYAASFAKTSSADKT